MIIMIILTILVPLIPLLYIAQIMTKLMTEYPQEKKLLDELNSNTLFHSVPSVRRIIIEHLIENGIDTDRSKQVSDIFIKTIYSILIYILIGIIYFIAIIAILINFMTPILVFIPRTFDFQMALLISFFQPFAVFYLKNLMDYLGFNKLAKYIDKGYHKLSAFNDFISSNGIYLCSHFIGIAIFGIYILLTLIILKMITSMYIILFIVVAIFFYNKIVNKFLLKKINYYFDKKKFPGITVDSSIRLRNNYTFCYMIIITLGFYLFQRADSDLLYSFTIVFLVDTYQANHKRIKFDLKDDNIS